MIRKYHMLKPMLNMWPQGWDHFWPQGHYFKNLVDVYLVILHTNYESSRPCCFRQEDFFHVSLYKPM